MPFSFKAQKSKTRAFSSQKDEEKDEKQEKIFIQSNPSAKKKKRLFKVAGNFWRI